MFTAKQLDFSVFTFYFLPFYTCSHTVRKYLRHTARRAVEFISLQAFTQVVISFSLAASMKTASVSAVSMARTFNVCPPALKPLTACTSEVAPERILYNVGAKLRKDSIVLSSGLSLPVFTAAKDVVPFSSFSLALPSVWKYFSRKASQLANRVQPLPLPLGIIPTWA